MSNAIQDALAEVEAGEDVQDPGAGSVEMGEEPNARPEGPMPEGGEPDLSEEESGGFDFLGWARSVPDGSHTDFDRSDWWDPKGGAETRLAFHLSDAAGAGAGYPNGLGVLVALGELYWSKVRSQQSKSSSSEESEPKQPQDADTVARDTAEALV